MLVKLDVSEFIKRSHQILSLAEDNGKKIIVNHNKVKIEDDSHLYIVPNESNRKKIRLLNENIISGLLGKMDISLEYLKKYSSGISSSLSLTIVDEDARICLSIWKKLFQITSEEYTILNKITKRIIHLEI